MDRRKGMKKSILLIAGFFLAWAASAEAVVPQKWLVRSYDDFLRGKFDGVSISEDGVLSLSPREEKIEGPSEEFYLSFLMASDGLAYLGTGHGGKIFRITKEGKVELYFQTSEMDVTSLAMDKKGVLYAGTSPNGKIYKIVGQGKDVAFFNPGEKYIWDMLFRDDGSLLVAVGESGGIYEVNPQGEGTLVFKAEENHILCLRIDPTGDVIAGSGGNGLVYRVGKGWRGAVAFESPFEEVRSLVIDGEGNIYAAAGGTATKARKDELPLAVSGRDTDVTVTVSATAAAPQTQVAPAGQAAAPPSRPLGISRTGQKEPSALFKIAPDGMSKRLWSSSEELIYCLFWIEAEKKAYFGTGPKGRMYSIDRDEKAALVLQKISEQIYGLLAVDSKIYMLSNNPSQLSILYPEQRLSGEYLSPVMDAKVLASWGKIGWEAEMPSGATLQFLTRSGNSFEPSQTWSDWSPPYQKKDGEQILSPKARYLQFRVLFKAVSGKMTPALAKVALYYLQTNVAPAFSRLELLGPNEVYLKPPEQEEIISGLERRNPDPAATKNEPKFVIPPKKVERKGYQTLTWDATDENEDTISYSIFLRQEGEKGWRQLDEKWTETVYTFQTQNFPDGVYFIKVVASDLPSNPPDLEKQADKTSQPLVIDNSAPVLKNFQAVKDKNQLTVTFQADDGFSAIKEVKYLVRPDDWHVVFPEDGICDSKQESFKFKMILAPNSDNLMTVIVKDNWGNIGVFRQIF
jgi:hypothetical protein